MTSVQQIPYVVPDRAAPVTVVRSHGWQTKAIQWLALSDAVVVVASVALAQALRFGKVTSGLEIVDKIVTQSSDEAFHCLAITLFFNQPPK